MSHELTGPPSLIHAFSLGQAIPASVLTDVQWQSPGLAVVGSNITQVSPTEWRLEGGHEYALFADLYMSTGPLGSMNLRWVDGAGAAIDLLPPIKPVSAYMSAYGLVRPAVAQIVKLQIFSTIATDPLQRSIIQIREQ